ncbi:MAG: DUF1848 domain-containing protein [Bacilli bacterium]|nr:DUF1848 domain-containing protein [Bacilli bacterium]
MVLMVSGRTDIVAFYTEWFMNRYKEGFVDVRNPFYKKMVSRIYFKDVDLIMFCTKNPIPLLPYLKSIKHKILFHITLTPYHKDIEPNLPPKGKIIEAIKEVSKIVGKENVYVRYDPIFISGKYSVAYHVKSFDNMCNMLSDYVKHIIVSFIDEYKNTVKNKSVLKYRQMSDKDYEIIGKSFSESASKNDMTIQTCFEKNTLTEYGFIERQCLSKELAYQLTGKKYKLWQARKCGCVEMADIGAYNSCKHLCKYCYANFDEDKIIENCKNHNPNSSLLIGHLNKDDEIKIRKD